MSLGNDLSTIRKGLGLSLEEVQNSIKIPITTLKSIENNSIFDDPSSNKAYTRSFVRSYAKALKIKDADIVAALDSNEAGIYESDLIKANNTEVESTHTEEKKPFSLDDVSAPDIEIAEQKKPPTIENVNWADLGKQFNSEESNSKIWVILVIIFVVLGLVSLGIYFRSSIMSFFGSEPAQSITQQESTISTPPDNNTEIPEVDLSDQQTVTPTPAETVTDPPVQTNQIIPSQADTLTIAIYAAYGILDPVRVTNDLTRQTNPFWIEEGQAYYFDFKDTVLVRGQYSRMLLMFNGHVIENARQNYFNSDLNSVMLTRSIFENPTYQQAPPQEFPYIVGAPDSISYWRSN